MDAGIEIPLGAYAPQQQLEQAEPQQYYRSQEQAEPQQQQQQAMPMPAPRSDMRLAANDKSLYTRQVPGISNGELVRALYEEQQQPRNEPQISDAFTRTSAPLYHHYARSSPSSSQHATLQQPSPATNTAEEERWARLSRQLGAIHNANRAAVEWQAEVADETVAHFAALQKSIDAILVLVIVVGILVLVLLAVVFYCAIKAQRNFGFFGKPGV